MKKKVVILAVASIAAVSIAVTSVVTVKLMARANQTNQILIPKYSYFEDFDSFNDNEEWSHQAFYTDFANGTIVSEGAIKGKSLKLDIPHRLNWGSINFKSEMINIKNSEFHIEFSCKTKNIDSIDIPILKDFDGEYYAQYGVKITNDENGNPQSLDFRYGDSLIKEENVVNRKRELNDGVISIAFDFTVGEQIAYPSIRFHSTENNSVAIVDNIIISDKNNPGEYYEIQYADDFNDITSSDVFNSTPFWCQNGTLSFVTISRDKKVQYSGEYRYPNGDNVLLGGLTRTELTTLPNTLYYYSYDLILENIEQLVITTLDKRDLGNIYSEITYYLSTDQFKVTAAGGISNFNAKKEGNVYHISYNRQTSSFGEDEHKLFATSVQESTGNVIFDNFVVAHK